MGTLESDVMVPVLTVLRLPGKQTSLSEGDCHVACVLSDLGSPCHHPSRNAGSSAFIDLCIGASRLEYKLAAFSCSCRPAWHEQKVWTVGHRRS